MPEIRLINCLVVPSNSVGRITQQHVVTIKINNNKSVHSLRSQIKKEHTSRFDNILITEFVVHAIPLNSDKVLASVNAEGVMISVNSGRQDEGQALISMLNILDHFPKQSSEKDIHIIIYLDIKTPQ
ncbi:hypothetical protein C1645_835254 [Glomus cerebriforme]|uniref:Crinkler effector protein N-terminal domain-containing protein n=1 Tax=Glomus cerebriforme TaxID=658196 RepID=A0A397SCR1_9GLOM|nr:hypothetical protein C1645_835254 [Glomus cerebriforme]